MKRADLSKLWKSVAPQTGTGVQEAVCAGRLVTNAGHGDPDPGTMNARYDLGRREQALDVARRLRALLGADGHTTCMTRTGARHAYVSATRAEVLLSGYTSALFGKWSKNEELAHAIYEGFSALPAADETGTLRTREPYSFASGVMLKSEMPAAIAEIVFATSDAEGRLLPDGTDARQKQIATASKTWKESCLARR